MGYGVFPHNLHIYQKPAIGNAFLSRLPVYNYRHTIAAIGGFDTASCDIAIRSREEGQKFLDQYLGNRVAFYVDNPVEPIWEGFINRMTFSAGGVQYTISLDEMANDVIALYTASANDPSTTQTAAATATVASTASQNIYGIKQEQIDLGVMVSGTGTTVMRDNVLAQRAFPKTSTLPGGGGEGLLHIEFLGFFHTLAWGSYRNTGVGAVQMGALIDTVLGTVANGTTFFDNADLTRTVANTATIDTHHSKGETALDVLIKLAEIGSATITYIIGISPTDFQTNTRRFYYQAASSEIVYTARQSDGLRIRNLYGQLVPPWTVRPDAGIRVSDMLIGWDGIGDNPTETYISTIEYDSATQKVIYHGADNLSVEGVFNIKRYNKGRGKAFGAARRLA